MSTLIIFAIFGIFYGFLIGLIPVAGVSTALITIFGFLDVFRAEPYTLVVFTTAIVVACSIGDTFSSVVMNIPGSGGSAASMVDGFPLTKQGQAARALSAAITTSTINGILFGCFVFLFLPYYTGLVTVFAVPELFAFILVAFASICFIASEKWIRSIIALALGIFLGLVGQDPNTQAYRYTFGWEYLAAGIQIAPVLAGVLAFPELIETYMSGFKKFEIKLMNVSQQIKVGIKDSFTHWRDGLRGGFIGGLVGLLPGVGGSVADWMAYGQTVSSNKNEKIPFGKGNIKGVIGCEGANNAQKATGYIPMVLFAIPSAPFEAILMALFIYVGFEMGTPDLFQDKMFFSTITVTYLASCVITFIIAMLCISQVNKIFKVPFTIWFWAIVALIVWSCVQYTGYWEDYAILGIFIILGFAMKKLGLSRAAFIIGFVLSSKVEKMFYQYTSLYNWYDVFLKPISGMLMLIAIAFAIKGIFFNKNRISYV